MSGLLRQPVNPIQPQPAPVTEAPAMEDYYPGAPSDAPVDMGQAATAIATIPAPPTSLHNVPATVPNLSAGVTLPPEEDGFDDIDAGFGAYDRVKLDNGMFWINGDKLGICFLAQMHQLRKVFVYRDRPDPNDKAARAVWSYDKVNTTQGEPLKSVFELWAAEGFDNPTFREVSEVVAEIKDGAYAGNLVMLAVPHQSTNRLAGYRDRLRITKRLRPTQVITQVSIGGHIKSGNTTFTPWQFDFFAEA